MAAEGRMSTGNNDEMEPDSISDLSIDNRTFDQHIDLRSEANSGSIRPTTEVLGQDRTVDEGLLTPDNYGTDFVGFIRIQRTPTSDSNAFLMNVLPTPALPSYVGIPPPSTKVGKFVKYPGFCSYDTRLQSFHQWPLEQPSPAALASAGFIYQGVFLENGTAVNDQVYCFKCGGCIRQWEKGDDPSKEHFRLHPSCLQEIWLTDEGK